MEETEKEKKKVQFFSLSNSDEVYFVCVYDEKRIENREGERERMKERKRGKVEVRDPGSSFHT